LEAGKGLLVFESAEKLISRVRSVDLVGGAGIASDSRP
jgi:hypothetical protein